jgi:hypothetical protein
MEFLTVWAPLSNLAREALMRLEIPSNLAASAKSTSTSALSSAKAAFLELIILNYSAFSHLFSRISTMRLDL